MSNLRRTLIGAGLGMGVCKARVDRAGWLIAGLLQKTTDIVTVGTKRTAKPE